MKKKVIGPILCFIFIIATVFGTLYAVDHQRMKNNEPVVFSTWGKKYVPPVNDYPIRNGVNPDEEQSFVGTVIEETTSYMVVEPAHDEYEKTVADRIKIEYGTDHIDYLYGTGRMVVIYYKGDINTADGNMASIKSDDISTEGFREWEMKVVPSNEPNNKKIMEKTQPHDSDTTSHWYKQYNLYYHGLEDVIITVDGEQHSLAHALKRGKITMSAILAKANQDVADGVIEEISYDDGGSSVFKYPDYTIVKYHTLDGNDDMYIGTPVRNHAHGAAPQRLCRCNQHRRIRADLQGSEHRKFRFL